MTVSPKLSNNYMTQTKQINIACGLIFFASSLLFGDASLATTKSASINITTEYHYPLNISEKEGGAIYGQSADKVHEMFKRGHLSYQMTMMSWNRAFELARNNADTCVFSTVRTSEREANFQWIGPLATGVWSIFGSPDKLGKVIKLDDIEHSTIGTELGNVAVSFLTEKGFEVVTSMEADTTFKNVAIGRIDYAAAGDEQGKKMINKNQLKKKVVLLFDFHTSDYYLACNKKMKPETIALLNQKLNDIKADGTFKRINHQYQ